ncbi:MAG: hypothetical protein JWN14_4289 [Chthonomonadales bacterium]|nr:hypothetical protein [Chthonomonadales bacterium]
MGQDPGAVGRVQSDWLKRRIGRQLYAVEAREFAVQIGLIREK